uniref:Uncharacterized protein n=1 Tax=Arundo donax TaxID=35708 RepID=A0A0A8Y025_ARUDO
MLSPKHSSNFWSITFRIRIPCSTSTLHLLQ